MTEPSSDSPASSPEPSEAPASAPPAAASPRKGFFRRHWLLSTLLVVLGLPALGFGVWTAVALNWSYSSGKRAGYVQKISRKGFVCKTWEGTLYTDIAKGFRSDSFSFSVRDDAIARQIEQLSGKRVAVEYEQHLGVPTSCFGETEYFITGVQSIPE